MENFTFCAVLKNLVPLKKSFVIGELSFDNSGKKR